ncbi:MAG: glycosyltransferase family 4 protein [Saprospiraceae bacterium]|nr:glycosyltransferase family 4 protein [Saprospiraceae bacterium]
MMELNDMDTGHSVDVLTKDYSGPPNERVHVFRRKYPRGIGVFWEYWDNLIYLQRVNRLMLEHHYDVVVFVDAVLGYLTARRLSSRVPVVGLVNDDEYLRSDFGKATLSREWFIKWKSRWLEKAACHSMRMVFANSRYLEERLVKTYGLNQSKIRLLYKGINLDKWPHRSWKVIDPASSIKVLFVKADFIRGGLFVLMEALNQLSELTFELIVCGATEEDYFKQRSPVVPAGHVQTRFLGSTRQALVQGLLQESDILCIPSLREALGVANMEGLAMGIPVVSSSAGGIPEVVGEAGWLCKAGDPISLAEQLKQCIAQEELRREKIRLGRSRVEGLFNAESMRTQLLDFLRTII